MSESFKAQQGMLTNKHTQFATPFQFEFSLNTLAWSQKKAGCYNLIKMTSAHFLKGLHKQANIMLTSFHTEKKFDRNMFKAL